MDEYFTHKCVTSDAPSQSPLQQQYTSSLSTWSHSARCEFVVVQENQGAHGASRAVLASIVNMTLQSRKTSDVLLFMLDSALLVNTVQSSEKLTHVDYSNDASLFFASLLQSEGPTEEGVGNKQLLTRLQGDINDKLDVCAKRNSRKQRDDTPASVRPVVVVLDSLNVLLEQYPLQKVLLFLRALRQNPQIGSVIVRFNATCEPKATRQVLTSESTAVALVETPSSLRAYPILAKERRREIPKEMHGFVLLLRQKKNGRSSESVDYFQIDGNHMLFFTAAQAEKKKQTTTSPDEASKKKKNNKAAASNESQSNAESGIHSSSSNSSAPAGSSGNSHQAALPVRQEEVSFNLSISVEEQLAKSRVQLPYMHQGQSSSASSSSTTQSSSTTSTANSNNTNLFFIDDDDPDWDDDDLDDDLDI